VAVVLVLAASCTSEAGCEREPRDPGCPDLRFSGRYYDEWHETEAPPIRQELGDAVYPACNDAETCGPDLGGFAATDVWLLDGVDVESAVIGYRQDTDTHVIFLRRGIDPDAVPGLLERPHQTEPSRSSLRSAATLDDRSW
jgi:hypothetical protein